MLAEIQAQCETLSRNYDALTATALTDGAESALAAAGIYTSLRKEVDGAVLTESCRILRSRTNVLSPYRGTIEFIVACKMAISGDPADYFDRTEGIRAQLSRGSIGGESPILAAMILADATDTPEEGAVLASHTAALFRQMKTQHRFLTDEYDLPFAAVLALTQRPYDAVLGDAEACFAIMKEQKFGESNAMQSLSHVLALYTGSAADKCGKITRVRMGLQAAQHTYPSGGRLALLGILAGVPEDADTLTEMIAEADDCLAEQPCFQQTRFHAEQDVRRMYAVSAVSAALGASGILARENTASISAAIEEAIMLWLLLMSASIF